MIKIGEIEPDDDNKDDLAKLLEDWESENQEFIKNKKEAYGRKIKDKRLYKQKKKRKK